MKARVVQELAKTGLVSEYLLPQKLKGSYLIKPDRIEGATFFVHVVAFIDNHHIILAHDHVTNILTYIYKNSLKPIVRTTNLNVLATVAIHVLGLANLHLAERAYIEYAGSQLEHPKVSFLAYSTTLPLRVFQYGAAPWTPVLRL